MTTALHPLGCVACGSDDVASTGVDPQTHRCHACALTWLNTDSIPTIHARIQLHTGLRTQLHSPRRAA